MTRALTLGVLLLVATSACEGQQCYPNYDNPYTEVEIVEAYPVWAAPVTASEHLVEIWSTPHPIAPITAIEHSVQPKAQATVATTGTPALKPATSPDVERLNQLPQVTKLAVDHVENLVDRLSNRPQSSDEMQPAQKLLTKIYEAPTRPVNVELVSEQFAEKMVEQEVSKIEADIQALVDEEMELLSAKHWPREDSGDSVASSFSGAIDSAFAPLEAEQPIREWESGQFELLGTKLYPYFLADSELTLPAELDTFFLQPSETQSTEPESQTEIASSLRADKTAAAATPLTMETASRMRESNSYPGGPAHASNSGSAFGWGWFLALLAIPCLGWLFYSLKAVRRINQEEREFVSTSRQELEPTNTTIPKGRTQYTPPAAALSPDPTNELTSSSGVHEVVSPNRDSYTETTIASASCTGNVESRKDSHSCVGDATISSATVSEIGAEDHLSDTYGADTYEVESSQVEASSQSVTIAPANDGCKVGRTETTKIEIDDQALAPETISHACQPITGHEESDSYPRYENDETCVPAQYDARLKTKGNDLTLVKGIGTSTERFLQSKGIFSLEQLSQMTGEQLRDVFNSAGIQFSMEDLHTWPLQARGLVGMSHDVTEHELLKEVKDLSAEIHSMNEDMDENRAVADTAEMRTTDPAI